jgi:hypothetical protein
MNKQSLAFTSLAVILLLGCSTPPSNTSENNPETINDPPTQPPITTIGVTAQWQAGAADAFSEIAAASAGDQGAFAYALVENSVDGQSVAQTRIMLQRIDSVGATNGAAIELGVLPNEDASRVTLASDGMQYMACWGGHDDKVACATASVATGAALPALTLTGHSPSIAYSSNEWALAYGTAGKIAVLHVSKDGMAAGNPVLFDGSMDPGSHIRLHATKAGFAILGESSDTMHVFPIDGAFSSATAPIDLGKPFWFGTSITASETTIAVTLGKPYGGFLFLIDGAKITSTQELAIAGDKTGMNAAISTDKTSFGLLSADYFSGLNYGLIDGAGNLTPTNGVLKLDNESYFYGSLAILKLKETNYLVASQGPNMYGGKIIIAQTTSP